MVSGDAGAGDWVNADQDQAYADRYTYLPTIGLWIGGTWAAATGPAECAAGGWRLKLPAWPFSERSQLPAGARHGIGVTA